MKEEERVIVLGLGNILCGDDGFGIHVIQRLSENFCFPSRCELIDGGTQGQLLYGVVEEADRLLLIDAVDFSLPVGSLEMRANADIPAWLGMAKLSAHQGSFAEVLALGALKGVLPAEIRLLGFQPSQVEFGMTLSQTARDRIRPACQLALSCLNEWGIRPEAASNPIQGAGREMRESFA